MPLWLIQIIVGVVLSVASTLLQQAFAPKEQKRTGTRGSAQIGGKVPKYILIGTVAEPGKREYRNAWGEVAGVPNANVTDVYSFGDLPITDMIGMFVNGVRVSIPETGLVTQGYPVPDYNDGSDHLWRKFYDGTQIVADSYLTSKFGADADRPWLSDMIGLGVPYLITTALWSETLWTSFPSFVGEFQGIPLYDPRQDTTAGGSGSQRRSNPSTWAFSDNNAVLIYNIERGIYYNLPGATTLGQHVWGGFATEAQMPYAVWAAAMNACDELVTLAAGGTEKRFRAGRRINLNERPADVIKELLIGANARYCPASDGTKYILVGVPATADDTFTDDDVLATEPLGSIPFPNLDGIINGATATYREPSQAWEDKETAPYLRSDLETEDDARQQVEGLDLGTTFSGTQAQRILQAVIEEGRRFNRHVVALPPEFAQYRPLQVLAWTSTRFDYTAKLFLITVRTRTPWGQVVFGLQEIDPADHAWVPGTDEQPLSFAPVVTNRPAPQAMTGWAVVPYTHRDAASNARRPGIEVSYAGGLVDVRGVRVQIRRNGETDPFFDSDEFPYDATLASPSNFIVGDFILPNQALEARGKFIPFSGRETSWSAWLDVTTPDIRLGFNDLDDALEGFTDWVGVRIRDLDEQMQLSTSLSADQDAANYKDRIYVLNQIVLGDDAVTASYTESILLALGMSGQSLADAITAVEAASGDITAGVVTRMTAFASPGGGWARYGIQARFAIGGTWPATASTYWDVQSDGTSRIVQKASEHYIVDDSDNVLALFKSGGAYFDVARIQDGDIVNVKIGTAAITNAKIDNLTIGTEKYSGNSIVITGFAANTSDFALSGTPANVVSVSITTNGGKVIVTGVVGYNSTTDQHVNIAIYKNGVQQSSESMATILGGKRGGQTLTWADNAPGAASNTYAVYAWGENADTSHVFSSISAENHKNA